ncbi:unnamed protein product [Rotaria sordida]|uniref:Uncharacterized protein n=1 Tax=Rotaria sordida TaxID=392033 RepID=A0A818RNX9_9BILA|nr:unnamed protein product [Rotaria sordida]
MVLASREDFAFSIPTGYSVKYVQNIGSFRQTTAQLATDMRSSLSSAREDLNRVHTGMERVPDHLKNMVLLIKHAPFDLLLMLFPDSFNNIEKLVNDSLIVLRKPEKNFEKVLNLLTEIDYLLNNTSNDIMIYLQVFDVKTQWTHLTELVTELAKQAERTRESFLLQFNWILKEFIRPDLTFAETHRDFIILLLLPKIVEIDQTSDILGIITKTYTDISFQFTDEQIGGYTHLLLLSKEEDRQRYLKQFQYDLVPQVVQSARLALNRHNEFLQRDRNRREIYEKFLTETSYNDLISLIEILLNRNSVEKKPDDHILVEQWQDYVLANAILANYLNILMVHASKSDFSLLKESNDCTTYIKNPNSFRQTISQLSDNIRHILLDLYKDLNHIQIGLERFPIHLKTILLLIKKGNNDTISIYLPKLLKKGENIVNESLFILKNPKIKIEQVKDLLIELNSLISNVTPDISFTLQIEDVKTQWTLFHDLFTQLSIQAENAINDFLLQFNWILEQFIQLNINNYRDLIINLLKLKVIEIERTIDLLTIISQTYVDISLEYANEKIISNTHLISISDEQERKEIIKQYRYELQPIAVKFARLALTRHNEFLQRIQNRERIYEDFLNEMSENDLNLLLTIN